MRRSWAAILGRFAGLVLVTVFALAVMAATSLQSFTARPPVAPKTTTADDLLRAPAVVALQRLEEETIDVVHTYSGMIRPKDRYSLGFEVGGRVQWIKQNANAEPIDIGDPVSQGEVLARLDEHILQARKREAAARLTLARDSLQRATESRDRIRSSVSDAELQRLESEVAVALAQLDVTEQQLADATLRSPIDGVVARRMVEEGETVGAHEMLFEVVKVNEVLLVVGVPESRLPEINRRAADVAVNQDRFARARQLGQPVMLADDDLRFTARVRQLGQDRFGRAWPDRPAEVYRIGEAADQTTGLFEVEILIDNADRSLKPGYIALADVVIDRLHGFRLPIDSVQFRDRKAYMFTAVNADGGSSAGTAGQESLVARRHELQTYIEQKDYVILPTRLAAAATDPPLDGASAWAVSKGQHRLVDGRSLDVVARSAGPGEAAVETASPRPAERAGAAVIGARP
ncbi:MAG: efflux RND transporter periplasmic adaptor subunit [Planctomycetales bacterium]|nr:efflux RND transporter periplasmic adaptor subunit [Planctomycetales bacterium]